MAAKRINSDKGNGHTSKSPGSGLFLDAASIIRNCPPGTIKSAELSSRDLCALSSCNLWVEITSGLQGAELGAHSRPVAMPCTHSAGSFLPVRSRDLQSHHFP